MSMKIGINFPTNIGDTILAFPVLDLLRENFPAEEIVALASPRTRDLLSRNNFINEVILFDKKWTIREKMRFSLYLRGKFDLFIDLKNTFLQFILASPRHTPILRISSKRLHKKNFYLNLVKNLVGKKDPSSKSRILLQPQEEEKWRNLFSAKEYLFVATSSASSLKSYPSSYLKEVINNLKGKFKIVLLGKEEDKYYEGIDDSEVINLSGKTYVWDIFFLLENYARLLLSVDSSILHIASYLDVPVVSLFGPTSELLYGPYSKRSVVLKREDLNCRPCGKAKCRFLSKECMMIEPQKIVEAILKITF